MSIRLIRRATSFTPASSSNHSEKSFERELEPKPRFNEVMVDGVHADVSQSIDKLLKIMGHKGSRQHDDVGGTEIEWLIDDTIIAAWVLLDVLLDNLNDLFAHSLHRGELAYIDAGQSFCQPRFIAGR